jgi:hypothetical protein
MKIEIEKLSLTYPIISGQSFLARKSLFETIVDIFSKTKKKKLNQNLKINILKLPHLKILIFN